MEIVKRAGRDDININYSNKNNERGYSGMGL